MAGNCYERYAAVQDFIVRDHNLQLLRGRLLIQRRARRDGYGLSVGVGRKSFIV